MITESKLKIVDLTPEYITVPYRLENIFSNGKQYIIAVHPKAWIDHNFVYSQKKSKHGMGIGQKFYGIYNFKNHSWKGKCSCLVFGAKHDDLSQGLKIEDIESIKYNGWLLIETATNCYDGDLLHMSTKNEPNQIMVNGNEYRITFNGVYVFFQNLKCQLALQDTRYFNRTKMEPKYD